MNPSPPYCGRPRITPDDALATAGDGLTGSERLIGASPYAFRRQVDNTYLVRERDRRRRRDLFRVVAVLLPLGLGLLTYTWIHQEVLATGYRVNSLERRLDELTRSERELLLEAAYLASPERIEERATADLGMTPPTLAQTVFWEELP